LPIEALRPSELSPEQIARWIALQTPGLDSPFLSPHWAIAVERAQQGGPQQTRAAIIREGEREGYFAARVGAATAMPAGAPMCDYQGVVAHPELAVDPKALVAALGVRRLDFTQMLVEQAAFAPYAKGRSESWVVDVTGGFAAYRDAQRADGARILKDTPKKRRKAEREAGEVRFTPFSKDVAALEQLIEWKRGQFRATGQTDIFEAPWTGRLLRELFETATPEFGASLYTLHMGDKLAAAHLHLHGLQTIHGWIIAHDNAFERYSPGIILFLDILTWMDGTPYNKLDLGPGDYRFKSELSNRVQGVVDGFVGLPSAATLTRAAVYGVKRAAEALPLGKVSDLPGKAMRRMDRWRGLR
jgi:CelD/BcsL family acetyltransferase involved in cellulose biosynthesis